jgi:hypothetical protein
MPPHLIEGPSNRRHIVPQPEVPLQLDSSAHAFHRSLTCSTALVGTRAVLGIPPGPPWPAGRDTYLHLFQRVFDFAPQPRDLTRAQGTDVLEALRDGLATQGGLEPSPGFEARHRAFRAL